MTTGNSEAPVVLITGASRGIGKQLAIDFADHGYNVVCLARSSAESPSRIPGTVDETAELVRAQGREALPVQANVLSEEQVAAAVARAYDTFGRVDMLINNAGVAPQQPFLDTAPRISRRIVEVSLFGSMQLMLELCPRMIAAGGGRVINISSGAATGPSPGRATYSAAKRGLEAFGQSLAAELADDHVAVNALRVDMTVWSEGFAFNLPGQDLGDFEDPQVVSDACLWLAEQPLEYSGQIVGVQELRGRGIVRPVTRMGDRL